jgi:hypothetical protein
MGLSKTYRLPAPELLDSADGPTAYENLARAVEGQAFPTLQAQKTFTGDVNLDLGGSNVSFTLYSEQIASSGVVGWVDIDAYLWTAIGYPPDGTAGILTISVNGARVGYTRYHNYWVAQMMPVYVSARWPNLSGVPATVTVTVARDSANTPTQSLRCTGMSYQIYGAKVPS